MILRSEFIEHFQKLIIADWDWKGLVEWTFLLFVGSVLLFIGIFTYLCYGLIASLVLPLLIILLVGVLCEILLRI